MNCKNCGAILNSDDLFCKQCGQSVNNESNNMNNNQNQTVQSPNMNSYSNNNEQNYQQYNNYNNSNSGNVGKIILIIVLVIVFWAVGWFLGKVLFEEKDTSTNLNNTSSILNSSTDKNTNNTSNNNSNSNITISKNSSYIVTENGKKVYFEVANTLKEDTEYSKDDDRWFEKTVGDDDLLITVTEEYATMEEYMTDLEDTANRRKSNPEYNNVQLSEIKTKTINGKEFKLRTLDYNMGNTKFKDLYIVYEIENESLYLIEVEEYQLLTDTELNGLLNISIVE